jgi:hypothetical protein
MFKTLCEERSLRVTFQLPERRVLGPRAYGFQSEHQPTPIGQRLLLPAQAIVAGSLVLLP